MRRNPTGARFLTGVLALRKAGRARFGLVTLAAAMADQHGYPFKEGALRNHLDHLARAGKA